MSDERGPNHRHDVRVNDVQVVEAPRTWGGRDGGSTFLAANPPSDSLDSVWRIIATVLKQPRRSVPPRGAFYVPIPGVGGSIGLDEFCQFS